MPNDSMSFKEILRMITNACNDVFYHGVGEAKNKVIECATQIYIAQNKGGDDNAE